MTKICPECGAENPDEQIYCQECYAKLEPVKSAVWKEEVIPTKAAEGGEEAPKSEEPQAAPEAEAPQEAPAAEVTKEEAMAALKKAKAAMKEAKDAGRDISEAKTVFMDAKPALDAGDYARALEIANTILNMLG